MPKKIALPPSLKQLLEKGDTQYQTGISVDCVIFGFHEQQLKILLLKVDTDPNAKNIRGDTGLHRAARYGHTWSVRILLNKGANINEANNRGYTPLNSAITNEHLDCVKLLLQNGANPEIKNN